ncbi:MAG TPA: tetratricopeptide repeat protein [Polyangiaceae bacterium]
MNLQPQHSPYPTIEAIYAVGHYLLEQERPADAVKVFRVMLHAAPRDERAWLGLGRCHEQVGHPRIALEVYGAGSVVAGPSARCEVARGRVLRALDRDDEAAAAFERAAELADTSNQDDLAALVSREARAS